MHRDVDQVMKQTDTHEVTSCRPTRESISGVPVLVSMVRSVFLFSSQEAQEARGALSVVHRVREPHSPMLPRERQ